jgi:hypothetical protein
MAPATAQALDDFELNTTDIETFAVVEVSPGGSAFNTGYN